MKHGSFIVPILIFLVLTIYITIRGSQVLRSFLVFRWVYVVGILLMATLFIVSFVWGAKFPQAIAKPLTLTGYSYLILSLYLLVSFVLVDLVRILNYFAHFWQPHTMASIRLYTFIASTIVIAVVMAIGNYKFKHPEIVHLKIEAANSHQGKLLRIVALSDIHLGVTIDKKNLQKYVDLINQQNPDIVIIAGDISDREVEPLIKQNMDEEFRQIKAPFGVYAISGNHEYFVKDSKSTERFLEKAGVTYLRDKACLVDSSFYIIGRDDRVNKRRAPLSELVKDLEDGIPRILLDHQPFNLEKAEQNSVDLQLSGHTHGGQFFPINLIVNSMYEKGHGYHERGNTKYYVSSGLGIWGPQYRIGSQSELVVIDWKY